MNPQDHYAALIQSSDDAIIAKDLEGIVLSWNPAAEALFGWTYKEMVGHSIRCLLPDDRQDEEDLILARIREGEKVGLLLTDRLHKDGHRIPVSVTISPVRDPAGRIIGASKIARDASGHIATERQLRESENRFRLLAENIAQLAWIAEADGDIFWYNQRWYDYTGTTLDEMKGWGWRAVHHPDHLDRVETLFRQQLEAEEEWEDIFPLRSADGQWGWFLSRAKPIRDEDGRVTHWFGTNTDITEQREQTEQINLLLREVNHRSKNMLAKVQALARSSIGADEQLVRRFEQRVGSLAVNQDILVRRDWREVPVDELVRLQLRFIDGEGKRVARSGPDCALIPRAAEIVGMALHELATNSLKYGALSVDEGHVAIDWSCSPEGFTIAWRERGGPRVKKPKHRGFGSQLIEDIPGRALGGTVVHHYDPKGVSWELSIPESNLADRARLTA
ncbi:Blue-light-activated histidine kinase [Tsuneonella dongtanensis]|uniref:histidine kinase n=1 Tax=Tsuneonella dongtanensis TaxID=692370 RepID=A0A1B2AC90_9SPHN|nr:PAS domain S-box protein [Tsuneonella dongtanensis]ANY19779.1 Blue-light-activated histidine kinase [Tsuneonella dongtanensis]